jgi:putative intracellular protease/amidase
VELAQVLKEFKDEYEFTFATPDGNTPQLDINGMGLAMHGIEKTGPLSTTTMFEQRRRSFDVDRYRQRHATLVERREQELQLLERHLGRLPVSEILPNTEREATAFRPDLVRRLAKLPTQTFHSLEALVRRHRDPDDEFTFAQFDFLHAPGGHAPMVDFRDNPWLGEALHLARENGVLISLICHAPSA